MKTAAAVIAITSFCWMVTLPVLVVSAETTTNDEISAPSLQIRRRLVNVNSCDECSEFASCTVKNNGKLQCKCNQGYSGNGLFCNPLPFTTEAPTGPPTDQPTQHPTKSPTDSPTRAPTDNPTESPTDSPTKAPTDSPTDSPTKAPTDTPTKSPTDVPSSPPSPTPCVVSTVLTLEGYQPVCTCGASQTTLNSRLVGGSADVDALRTCFESSVVANEACSDGTFDGSIASAVEKQCCSDAGHSFQNYFGMCGDTDRTTNQSDEFCDQYFFPAIYGFRSQCFCNSGGAATNDFVTYHSVEEPCIVDCINVEMEEFCTESGRNSFNSKFTDLWNTCCSYCGGTTSTLRGTRACGVEPV